MDERLRSETQATLSTLAAIVSFPYIWLGLFLLLSLMYGGNFFGQGLGGDLVAALLCLGLLNPLVPGLVSNFIARPIFLHLLGRELISTAGCLTGLAGLILTGLGVLYFLARDLMMTLVLFLAAPMVGGLLAVVVSAIGRGGFIAVPSRYRKSPPRPEIGKPERHRLPGKTERPSLPGSRSSRLPAPRRSERTATGPRNRVPPPRRRGE